MIITPTSRYRTTQRIVDDNSAKEVLYIGEREPLSFVDDPENDLYVVQAGDTLQSITANVYKNFEDAVHLAWLIAEFQPTPIVDMTQRLKPGSVLVIPADSLVHTMLNVSLVDTVV